MDSASPAVLYIFTYAESVLSYHTYARIGLGLKVIRPADNPSVAQ